jgi:AcrR family transcriptional regulator
MSKMSGVQDRIVHAAAILFSKEGYHGTSTREIARLANVSEVTVYRYFEHKEDIFWSALESSFSGIKPRLKLFSQNSRNEEPEIMIPRIISLLRDIVSFSPELVRLVAVACLEVRGRAEDVCREHLVQLLTAIADYLNANMETGRVRNLNPATATAAIALTTFAQPEISRLTGWGKLPKLDNRSDADAYTDFWLKVLVPSPEEHLQGSVPAMHAITDY